MTDQALVPVEQKQVLFYEDEVTAVRLSDGAVFVPLRPLCRLLDIDWDAQRRRVNRDPVLSNEVRAVVVTTTARGDGRPQTIPMLCLPLRFLNGWLFGISATRVKVTVRDRLIQYQRECYEVLFEAFQEGRLSEVPDILDVEALAAVGDGAAQALLMAQAIVKIARQQLAYQQKTDERLEGHAQRLEDLETAVSELGAPGRYVTNAQASQLSQAVKAVAMAMSKQTRRNEYGGVYGELYRRYDITGYKMLPARKFEDAMSWLSEWLAQLNTTDGF